MAQKITVELQDDLDGGPAADQPDLRPSRSSLFRAKRRAGRNLGPRPASAHYGAVNRQS
jgi:hypothetical protein